MYSGRKYNVKRHIINMHNGLANIVSFIDYLAGRRQATYYFPNAIPSYLTKQQQTGPQTISKTRPSEILRDELFRAQTVNGWDRYEKLLLMITPALPGFGRDQIRY